ncbi:MAG: InlB B-repeat-containing protein [Eubacteriales bacterium]
MKAKILIAVCIFLAATLALFPAGALAETQYTVSFESNGGTAVGSQVKSANTTIATAPATTKTGNTLAGWYLDAGLSQKVTFPYTVSGSVKMYAKWNPNQYTVTFLDYNGTVLAKQTVNYGSDATAPSVPARTGYTFLAWDHYYYNITGDLTVTATYRINKYTVAFETDGGTSVTSITKNYQQTISPAPVTQKQGYNFAGWYLDSKCTNQVSFPYTVSSDLILYAKWNAYTVTFKDYNGTVLYQDKDVTWNTAATPPPSPTRSGYRFTGWDSDFSHVTDDITVTAQYVQTFQVSFKAGSYGSFSQNSASSLQTVDSGSAASAPTIDPDTGYTFDGWDTDFSHVSAPLTVTAKYTRKSYQVTFKPGLHGSFDPNGAQAVQIIAYQGAADAPKVIPATGYAFDGWDTSIGSITASKTVTATYRQTQCSVVFKDHDGKALKTESVDYGTAASPPADPFWTGHTFSGWSPATFNKITANTVITAVYSGQCSLLINLQGKGTVQGLSGAYNYGQTIDLSAATETPESGYAFTGFFDAAGNRIQSITMNGNQIITAVFQSTDGGTANASAGTSADPGSGGITGYSQDSTQSGSTNSVFATARLMTPEDEATSINENKVPQAPASGDVMQNILQIPLWIWLVIILGILLILFIFFIVVIRRKKKNKQDEYPE